MIALAAAVLCVQVAAAQGSWPYITRKEVAPVPPSVRGEIAATVIGLPLFTDNSLPSGYREYRFEVECGLCLPTYLIRLRVNPKGKIQGDAYLLWFGYDSALAADTSERVRRMNNTPNNCESLLQNSAASHPALHRYRWCEARLSRTVTWELLLARLDLLGVLSLPRANGYAPDPPNLGIDTLVRKDRTFFVPRWDCGDMVSKSLSVSALVGAEYRSAHFWCLESRAPGKAEHIRVADAYELLSNVVESYRDTSR